MAQTSNEQSLVGNCKIKLSAADVLETYTNLLPALRSQLIVAGFRKLSLACQECANLLKSLTAKIKDLEKAVAEQRITKIKQIQQSSEAAQTQANSIQKSINDATVTTASLANVTALAVINEQVKTQIQDLLPRGENKLNAKASGIINDIARLIKESDPLQENLKQAQMEANTAIEQLDKYIKEVEGHILKAVSYIDAADNLNPGSNEVAPMRKYAGDELKYAIEKTEKNLQPDSLSSPIAKVVFNQFILLLNGIENWILNPATVTNFLISSLNRTPMFLPSSFKKESANSLLVEDALTTLLKNNCHRDSTRALVQTASCIAATIAYFIPARINGRTIGISEKVEVLFNFLTGMNGIISANCESDQALRQLATDIVNAHFI